MRGYEISGGYRIKRRPPSRNKINVWDYASIYTLYRRCSQAQKGAA